MAQRARTGVLVLFCLVGAGLRSAGGAVVQNASPAPGINASAGDAGLKRVSEQEYAAQIGELRAVAAACGVSADACDAAKVGEDVAVERAGASFVGRREWLRAALGEAKKSKDAERAELMTKVEERLDGDAAELDATAGEGVSVVDARTKRDAILSRAEFRTVNQNTVWTRLWATLGQKIDDFIGRALGHLPHSSGVMLAIEWGVLSLAAAGLLLWAWRTMRQQRMAVSAPVEAKQARWQKESDDWARRAEAQAAAGEWREAVHCVYWAAIVMLEGRRMWRANRARTPREYLPLLEAGSARQTALGGLTRIFERIWYGLRPADERDFERAQALLEQLKAA